MPRDVEDDEADRQREGEQAVVVELQVTNPVSRRARALIDECEGAIDHRRQRRRRVGYAAGRPSVLVPTYSAA